MIRHVCMLSALKIEAALSDTGTYSRNRNLAARRVQNDSAPQVFQMIALKESEPGPATVMPC